MNRRKFLSKIGSGTAAAMLARHGFPANVGGAETTGGIRLPNIILVITDDQGYGDFSCHGHPFLKTPNLDRLSEESVRLTDFHGSPICSPSRCAFMTGMQEYRHGVSHTRGPRQNMSLQATTIAQVLQTSGYSTGLFGKWHLGDDPEYQPHERGFDESHNFLAGMIAEKEPANLSNMDVVLRHNGVKEKTSGYCTDAFFNLATHWMGEVKGAKPFFACIPTSAPHAPPRCPEAYEKMYLDKVNDPKKQMPRYYGMIASIDENMGRLVAQLKTWGIERDTLLVYTTDNGASTDHSEYHGGLAPIDVYNAGMRGGKNTPYQGGTRVASFWRWPAGFQGGVDVDHLTSNIDLFPTVAELAGIKVPEKIKFDGRSLAALLKNPKAPWEDRFVFIHTGNWSGNAADNKFMGSAIRNERFRLVEKKELHDIKADPGETTNVIKEHPEVVTQMVAAYDKWWEEVLPAMQKNDKEAIPQNGNAEEGRKAEPAGPADQR